MKIWAHEKKIASLFVTHAEQVEQCLKATRSAIQLYIDEQPYAKESERVFALESEADREFREIRDVLYRGAFLPLLREDLFELGFTVDDVANAAEEVVQFVDRQQPAIPDELRSAFHDLAEVSLGSIQPLVDGLATYFKPKGRIKSVRDHVQEVRDKESASDAAERFLTQAIFKAALPLEHKLHLQQMVVVLAKISDRAEDAADRLEQVGLKSVV